MATRKTTTQPLLDTPPPKPVRLARLRIEGFRGHHELDLEIPPAGVKIRGANESGKTSIIAAIVALCDGRSCKGRDVENGEEAAVIQGWLVAEDGTPYHARRRISADGGSTVTVKGPRGIKGEQALLTNLVGTPVLFDPARFLSLPAAEQVAQAGRLFPCTLTTEFLARCGVTDRHDLSGHGLVALERVYQASYAQRGLANAAALAARQHANDSARDARVAAERAPQDAPSVKDAEQGIRAAQRALDGLHAAEDTARRATERSAGTRARIEKLRAEAVTLDRPADTTTADMERASAENVADIEQEITSLEERLADARKRLAVERADLARFRAALDKAAQDRQRAASLREQAADLEATLAATVDAPTPEAIALAEAALATARTTKESADLSAAAQSAAVKADRDESDALAAQAEAKRLDDLVRYLAKEAPAELMAESNILPGLGITSAGLTLDSGRGPVPLDICSTKQRWELAVRLACVASPQFLVVPLDDFEHFDPDNQIVLIQTVQEAGRTLVLTEVQRGAIFVEPLPTLATPESDQAGLFD